jgi:hypothetical protein
MSNYGSLQKQTASRLEIGGCARHSRVDGCPISVSRSGLATEYYVDDGNLTVGGARSDLAGLVIAQLVVLWTVGAGAVWSARRSVAAHSVRQSGKWTCRYGIKFQVFHDLRFPPIAVRKQPVDADLLELQFR